MTNFEPSATAMDTENASASQPVGDKLLVLRKEYNKTAATLAKAHSHLDFNKRCQELLTTPNGLKIKIECSALLAQDSDVARNFKATTDRAEGELVQHLVTHFSEVTDTLTHFSEVTDTLTNRKTTLVSSMESLKPRATTDELRAHTEMMSKTDHNLQKLSNNLGERKKRKLEALTTPQPSKRTKLSHRERKKKRDNPPRRDGPSRRERPPSRDETSNPGPLWGGGYAGVREGYVRVVGEVCWVEGVC